MRQRASIIQQKLADLLGVSRVQVSHVEAGRRGYAAGAQDRLLRLHERRPAPAAAPAPPSKPTCATACATAAP